MDIQIRRAKSNQWKIIQKLNNQVFQSDAPNDEDLDLSWSLSEKGIIYYKKLAERKYGQCYIAFSGKTPVGYIASAVRDFGYRKSKYVEIENMGVNPKFRSQGIGRLLIKTAEKWAKEQKAIKLYVEAYWGNKQGIKFYKRNGFYEIGLELDKKI